MSTIWIQIFAVIIGGSILKYVIPHPLAWVIIDLTVLGTAYFLLRRHPYIDLKTSMIFLTIVTVVNILIDLGMISGLIGNIALLALLAWMLFRQNRGPFNRPRLRHKWHK